MIQSTTRCIFAITLLVLAFLSFSGLSINPDLSGYLINLSEGAEGPGFNDKSPEIAISGNTIHVIWTQNPPSYSGESNLCYRRSTDSGKTWEAPVKIMVFKNGSYGTEVASRRLAVDGDVVHICTADYDYTENGTGKVHYFRSQNGGVSFESERIIVATSGNYKAINNYFIKASDGKVVVAYRGTGDKAGTWIMHSTNSGTSFSDTKISDESSYVADLHFNGEQMIVLHGNYSTSYGYITVGKVRVSTSQNGTSFTTNEISPTYIKDDTERERCYVVHGDHYSSKIVRSGNNIHVVFTGYTEGDVWTTFYARSTNGGNSFETAKDIGSLFPESLQNGSETVAAKNGNVYWLAATSYPTNNNAGNHFYFAYSHDNGTAFSEPRRIMNPDISHIGKSSLPAIVTDTTDETGKTLYLTGNWLFSTKSVDGGQSFSGSISLAPFLKSNIVNMAHSYMNSYMQMDSEGGMHWITQAQWRSGTDQDIFYRNVKEQPEPGTINKTFYIDNPEKSYETDLVVVPSSETIQFDSAMTAEVWVKFDPATEANFSILAKVNGYDGYDNRPEGFHVGFRQNKGAITVNAGIQTDREDPVNLGEIDLNDNLWHHIAFTYDANGGLNNFKLYINGLLHQQKTAIGAIVKEDGMLMLGARNMGNGWYYDAKYYMDDVRLWNRALTQDELLENQINKLTGQEEGLTLFLNFDDTFKDISGNGNDGIPVYKGSLPESDFNPPMTAFEIYQAGNSVSFNNKTKNATSWLWDFNNGNTSEQGNPKHNYTTPGEYQVALTAKNATTVTSAMGHVTIKGLDRIEPAEAGNIGECLLKVFGGGLNANMNILLRYEENTEIVADTIVGSGEDGFLQALFSLNGASTGLWDVVVTDDGNEMVLPKSFKIKQAEGLAQPWVNISGRGAVLLNRWSKFTLTYGNKGDVDALMVPVSFAVPDMEGLEVDFVDFEFVLPPEAYEYNLENELMPYKNFFVTDNLFGKPQKSKVYSLMIPRIKANGSESLHILIKSPDDYKITSWTGDGWLQYTNESGNALIGQQLKSGAGIGENDPQNEANKKVGSCIIEALAVTTIETSISIIPVAGAVYNSFKTGYTVGQFDKKDVKKSVVNSSLQAATTFFSYASVVPVLGWVTGTIGGLICGGISAYYAVSDCLSLAEKEKGVSAVSSFDPNEIIGPDGFGDKGWIPGLNELPYTILFENKAEATAPAHDVFITDTLDLSVFDISKFGFGAFGWGDTIFSPPGNELKEFSMDIDLRPELDLITRVSGKLDTLSGVVKWEFLSLNPETMDLEEDPFLGFLPPNVTSPEGEGFVSFSVGLKKELTTNAEIRNKAAIVFDANQPIITNEYLNTLDLDAPESKIYPLKETLENHFLLQWTGSDKGSGIQYYSIYVLENDTLLYPWLTRTPNLSAPFEEGELGSQYKFYSIATDNVSHVEAAPDEYDARTTITVNVEEFDRVKEELTVWPNPVKNLLQVKMNHAPCGMYVVELININGVVKHSQLYNDLTLQNGIDINVSEYLPGQYVLRMVFGNKTETRKVTIY